MKLAYFSVTRPVAVTMRIAALVLLGYICMLRLPIDLLPKVSVPTVSISTTWPNVAPEEIEAQVTRPIEQAVSAAPNVYSVSSTTTEGQSSVRVQFNWGTDVGQAAVDVLQLVERARQRFPTDQTLGAPIVYKYDPSTLPIRIYGVSGLQDPVALRTLLDNEISPLLESANGVAAATVTGGQTRAIIVDVDPRRLRAYGLSISDVVKRLSEENVNVPAGTAKEGISEFTIRSVGQFDKPEEALQIPISTVNGQPVRLSDIAAVKDSTPEVRLATRLNGEPAVGMIITKQSEANTVATAEAVTKKVEEVKKRYPGLKFGLAYDQAGFISNSIEDLKTTALIGGFLAVGILMMFLRNFRSTLVVALSIPISIISTFALLYFCGFTLNTISLSGLALASGLIVDDAVVVLENIFRHIERDKRTAPDAAVVGTSEISGAVVASTLTIIIVFMPLLLIKGQSGQTFSQFAYVVIFSILISLLDALTVVPMLASRFINVKEVLAEFEEERTGHVAGQGLVHRVFFWFGSRIAALDHSYRRVLEWALRHRTFVLGGAIVSSVIVYPLVPMIGSEMLPQTDSGDFTVNVKLPIGTALSVTNAKMREIENQLRDNPDVETVFAAAGTTLSLRGSTTAAIPYVGSVTARLKANRKHSTQDTIKVLNKQFGKIAGVRALVNPYDLVSTILTGGNANMEVDVFGSDLKQLSDVSKQVLEVMRGVPGLEAVDVNVQDASPEIQFKVDRVKAAQLGVSFNDIAQIVNSATNGSLATYYQDGGFQYPIYVRMPEDSRKSIDALMALPIPVKSASLTPGAPKTVRLSEIAKPVVSTGPNQIDRLDRQRYFAVAGRVSGRSESEVQADIAAKLKSLEMPNGMRWDFGQAQRRRVEEFSGLGVAIFLAVALIYMLLASQFESFVHPLVVLTSVPLSGTGVIIALFLTNRAFGLTAFIGMLMLIGIVVKNGILLVDYTNQLRGRGMPVRDAILQAAPTRLRPILMTSAAAILGMLPLALALGKGSETQAPLATAVIGGLTTSTLLTLLVVPVVYSGIDDLARRIRKDSKDLAAPSAAPNIVSSYEQLQAELAASLREE